jgi:hypothetical protein
MKLMVFSAERISTKVSERAIVQFCLDLSENAK